MSEFGIVAREALPLATIDRPLLAAAAPVGVRLV
jgi:hypothetical protein